MRAVKWMLIAGLATSLSLAGCDCGGDVTTDAGSTDSSVHYDSGRVDTAVVDATGSDTATGTDTTASDTAATDTAATDTAAADTASGEDGGTAEDAAGTDSASTVDSGGGTDTGSAEDGGGYSCTTLADVRATGNGNVDLYLCNVYVTYTRTIGYTVQDAPTGPALFVYTQPASPTGLHLAVGNKIDLHVTSLTAFQGLKQIDGSEVVVNDNGSYDVRTNLRQDLSAGAGTVLAEDLESELVGLVNARVVSGVGRNWVVEYGSAHQTADLYAYEAPTPALCPNATFTLLSGYVNDSNGNYEITSFYASDFGTVVDTNCAAYDDSNWDFEDFSTDPIDDFIYVGNGFTATSETTLKHGGNASANLTWTSTDNQDLVTGYLYPVTASTQYTCHWWVYDNDAAGRVRPYISWYDADGVFVSNAGLSGSGQSGYSSDQAQWAELSYQAQTPATGVAFMTCALRMYDVGGGFTTATVYVDDLSISSP